MTPRVAGTRRELEAELEQIHRRIQDLYWTFTRTARGRPPCLVAPDLHDRQRVILDELARRAKRRRDRRARK